jgi:hypothetical protein
MDRQAFQTGQLIPNAQLLGMEKSKLVGLGYALEAVMGAGGTVVSGLACSPTTVPSLSVVVGRGSIMTTAAIDGVAYSDLGTDTNATIKQGILQEPGVTLTLTPPSTPGYSQTYLIQAAQSDSDTTTTVPFYNAANPAQPYNGPNNSGNATLTARQSKCVVSLKAGAAATTGSQTAPSPDVGNVGLYTITLVNGQTAITSGQIVQLSTAPFIPATLPGIPAGIQSGVWTYGVDTGTANNYVVALIPNTGTLVTGQRVFVKFANANTTTSPVININGTGNKSILLRGGGAPAVGDIPAGWREIFYDGVAFRLAGAAPSETFTSITQQLLSNVKITTFSNFALQAVTNGNTFTTLIFSDASTPDFTNNGSSGFTVVTPGLYSISMFGELNTNVTTSGSNDGQIYVLKNGTSAAYGKTAYYAAGSGIWQEYAQANGIVVLAAGDILKPTAGVNANGFGNANAKNFSLTLTKIL